LVIDRAGALVIGGGCMGASIAYNLSRLGYENVALLERNFLTSGATGRSTAVIRLNYGNEIGAKLALEGFRVFRDFENAVGGTANFRQVGYLGCVDESNIDAMKESTDMQRRLGVNTKILQPSEIREIFPRISAQGIALATYEPDSGYADAFATTFSYAKQAERMGAKILEGVTVQKVLVEGGRATGVLTGEGRIEAPVVVAVAGVWTNKLLGPTGIRLPITVTRHEVGLFRTPRLSGDHPVVMDFTNWVYIRPEQGGMTIVGAPRMSGGEIDPDHYDPIVGAETLERYRKGAAARLPDFANSAPRGGWTGPYDNSPDLYPILDRAPGVEGLYVAAGFSGHGFKLTPAIGRVMAEFVRNGRVKDFEIERLGLSRFEKGASIRRRYSYEWE
jgi:sarcosine oxidase, subunit beta